jgi:predicted enzyme related to lactoylglutathione lyase
MAEAPSRRAVRLANISPQFVVPDVITAAEYYRDVLGFKIHGYFLDPPVYAIVSRDSVEIHFGKIDAGAAAAPNIRRREESVDAYIWVTDLDLLYAELKERGAKIVDGPAMRVYQCYEMVLEDCYGFRLAIGMDVSSPPGGSPRS